MYDQIEKKIQCQESADHIIELALLSEFQSLNRKNAPNVYDTEYINFEKMTCIHFIHIFLHFL